MQSYREMFLFFRIYFWIKFISEKGFRIIRIKHPFGSEAL